MMEIKITVIFKTNKNNIIALAIQDSMVEEKKKYLNWISSFFFVCVRFPFLTFKKETNEIQKKKQNHLSNFNTILKKNTNNP